VSAIEIESVVDPWRRRFHTRWLRLRSDDNGNGDWPLAVVDGDVRRFDERQTEPLALRLDVASNEQCRLGRVRLDDKFGTDDTVKTFAKRSTT